MQSTTGCKINVSQASGADVEREIGLVGTPQAIEDAKKAIWDKVDSVVSSQSLTACKVQSLTATRRRRMAAVTAPAGVAAAMAGTTMTTHSRNSLSNRTARQTAAQQAVPLRTETLPLTRMRRTVDTRTTWPCGMPRRWRPAGSSRKEEPLHQELLRRLTIDDSP